MIYTSSMYNNTQMSFYLMTKSDLNRSEYWGYGDMSNIYDCLEELLSKYSELQKSQVLESITIEKATYGKKCVVIDSFCTEETIDMEEFEGQVQDGEFPVLDEPTENVHLCDKCNIVYRKKRICKKCNTDHWMVNLF